MSLFTPIFYTTSLFTPIFYTMSLFAPIFYMFTMSQYLAGPFYNDVLQVHAVLHQLCSLTPPGEIARTRDERSTLALVFPSWSMFTPSHKNWYFSRPVVYSVQK